MTDLNTDHKFECRIYTFLPSSLSPAEAHSRYQAAFQVYEGIITEAGGSCDVDTTEFSPVLKFPIGTKVFHKNLGRDEGTEWVDIPKKGEFHPRILGGPIEAIQDHKYQPNVATIIDFALNDDGSVGYYTRWWNPQFTEHEWFPENELEAV